MAKKKSSKNKLPIIKENFECMLFQTPDMRGFFLFKKHLHVLVPFAKHVKATMSIVKVKSSEILELNQFVERYNSNYNANEVEFLKIRDCFPSQTKKKRQQEIGYSGKRVSRKEILGRAAAISSYIKIELSEGRPVSIQIIAKQFKNWPMAKSTISNHISKVKAELGEKGYLFHSPQRGIHYAYKKK